MKLEVGKTYQLSNGDVGTCEAAPIFSDWFIICGRHYRYNGDAVGRGPIISSEVTAVVTPVKEKMLVPKGRVICKDRRGVILLSQCNLTEKTWDIRNPELFIRILTGVPEFPVEMVEEEV